MHKPLRLHNLSLTFPAKTCFADVSTTVHPGDRIAIVGRNGSGKTSLLKILGNICEPSEGFVERPHDWRVGIVPQIIQTHDTLSGGQRVQKALTEALVSQPDLLLRDEPTNYLDARGKKHLLSMLSRFSGTLIIISHDLDLLRQIPKILWHIESPRLHVFRGRYDDYVWERDQKRTSLLAEETRLRHQEKSMHQARMREQKRASKSKAKGQKSVRQRKWPPVVSNEKAARAQEITGHRQAAILEKKEAIGARLSELKMPEVITPRFHLAGAEARGRVLQISDGTAMYRGTSHRVTGVNIALASGERAHVRGANASGKSLLLKAICGHKAVERTGDWCVPSREKTGVLDQHYADLQPHTSVFEHIHALQPNWSSGDVRLHLNTFLFRKNEEVMAPAHTLSGGEKVRLSLAMIAAHTPQLLLLDEVTCNLDLETKAHLLQVLKAYPGAMLLVCHEDGFVEELSIHHAYEIKDGHCEPLK